MSSLKMRELLFKNLTSADRKRRIISSCEVVDRQGMHTTIRRHFVCKVIEIKDGFVEKPLPQIYVCRICNHAQQQERYFCRMKAGLYVRSNERLFLVLFGHSLKIDLRPVTEVKKVI